MTLFGPKLSKTNDMVSNRTSVVSAFFILIFSFKQTQFMNQFRKFKTYYFYQYGKNA